jgi:predicted RNA-binding Zn ribbon-like protein
MTTSRFSQIGGNSALDFLNTQPMGDAGLDERLVDMAALIAWCKQAGLVNAADARRLRAAGESKATLLAVREMRESFRAALKAQQARRPDWNRLATLLNAALKRYPGLQVLRVQRGRAVLEAQRSLQSPAELVGLIAATIARFIAGPELAHARPCHSEDCVLWFVDRTRNHSRRWCRMESCGAQSKAKAYYWRSKRKDTAARARRG